jgi:hypothetical protein
MAKPTTKPIADADEKTRLAKRLGGKTGSLERRSIMMKAVVKTTPAPKRAMDFHDPQAKLDPPSEVNKMKDDAAMVKVMMPA